jgi:prepilin-type N-terminal cleavage/methylation domain-containing protein
MKPRGFTLVELMIVIAVIAVLAALAVPTILASIRAANERNASGSLKQVSAVQVNLKSSDLDQDGVNNFWTADVAGLYYLQPETGTIYDVPVKTSGGAPYQWTGLVPAFGPSSIKLIELSVALADADTVGPYDGGSISHAASPKAGYWFQTLWNYEATPNSTTPYGTRDVDRFGFIAWPDSYGSSGRLAFILSEGMTLYKRDPGPNYVTADRPTPGQTADTNAQLHYLYDTFPLDPLGPDSGVAAGNWSKLD